MENETIAVVKSTSGKITLEPPVSAEVFRQIVAENLPDTPKFIVDIFSGLAENLRVE